MPKYKYKAEHTFKRPKSFEVFFIILLVLGTVFTTTFTVYVVYSVNIQEDIQALEHYTPPMPSKIMDVNGKLISEIFAEKRELISYNEIPHDLIDAIVATEDSTFFEHAGIDLSGMMRALIHNIQAGYIKEGASTLTQQLARGVFDKIGRKKTIERKIQEIWAALQIEQKYTKKEILTLYFNQIFFGHSAYGVKAAARFYFDKDVETLSLAECALLAGLPKSPNKYSPVNNVKASMKRHKIVLTRMVDMEYITEEEADIAFKEFWFDFRYRLKNKGETVFSEAVNHAPYITEYIRRIIVERYGEDKIKKEGLVIHTTFDLEKQRSAQKHLEDAIKYQSKYYNNKTRKIRELFEYRIEDSADLATVIFNSRINLGHYKIKRKLNRKINEELLLPLYMFSKITGANETEDMLDYAMLEEEDVVSRNVEGALISIDPRTGHIEAMVGGSGFGRHNQLNRARQARRQAGSAFKPFLYSYAIESRMFTAASTFRDAPAAYQTDEGEFWVPQNYGGRYRGHVRLREALKRSINVVSVKLLDNLTIEATTNFTQGVLMADSLEKRERFFPDNLTLALGTGLFSPLELATGYAVIANRGVEVFPIGIRYVTDRKGRVIDNFEEELQRSILERGGKQQVMSEGTAYIITDILKDVLKPGGTAYRAMEREDFDRDDAAGKTGTSSDWKDAWFCGFTPQLVTVVWMGFDRNEYSLGRGQAGGSIAAPVWAKYMNDIEKDIPETNFIKPRLKLKTVQVCEKSGMRPSKSCKTLIWENFLKGTEPDEEEICNVCEHEQREQEMLEEMLDQITF